MEGSPNLFVPVALVAFALLALGAFLWMPRRQAVLAATIGGFLFVPVFGGQGDEIVPLLRTKAMFVPGVVVVLSLLFDAGRWRRFRPRLADLPIAIFCLGPVATSLANDLGLYDGLQGAFQVAVSWGFPYLLGRIYLGDLDGVELLATAVVVAALVYVPLCVWEVRMSPHLHHTLYGYRPYAGFAQSVRFGGFRPTVFMDHGLMVAMFMAGGALVATWLWWTGARRHLAGIPMAWVAVTLIAASLLTKSVGSNLLLAVGLCAMAAARHLRAVALVLALAAVPGAYAAARISGWSGDEIRRATSQFINPDRAQSIGFRLWNENLLIEKALEQPVLGWGRWGRGRVYDEDGKDVSTTDGLWVLALSTGGLTALAALLAFLALPAVLLWRAIPRRHWRGPRLAATVALLVWFLLWGIDGLANAMLTPIYPLAAGALTSLALRLRDRRAGRRPASAVRARRSHPFPARDHAA